MTIAVNDRLPDAEFMTPGPDGPTPTTAAQELDGKTVVLFAVPGAFTPTCSIAHAPAFVAMADKIKAKGVDAILCVSVNDAFVLDAWAKQLDPEGRVRFLADGSATFTKAIGMELDATGFGMGVRSHRYAMIVKDRVVTHLEQEENPGVCTVSGADAVLAAL